MLRSCRTARQLLCECGLLRGVLRLALCDWQLATVGDLDWRFIVEACEQVSQLVPTSSHILTKSMPKQSAPTLHQNCRCFCLSRTHPHRSSPRTKTRVSVGWATRRQHFKSDHAWCTSLLHTCLLAVSTLCDFRAVIWNNSHQKKTKLKDDPLPFSSELSLPLTLQSACPSLMFSLCFTCVLRFGRPAASPCRYCTERHVVCGFFLSCELIHGTAHAPTSCVPGLVVATCCPAGRVALGTQRFPDMRSGHGEGGNGRVSYFVGTQARTEHWCAPTALR